MAGVVAIGLIAGALATNANAIFQETVQEEKAAGDSNTTQEPTAVNESEPKAESESKAESKDSLGIVTTKPTEGLFVEVEGGFMVPYETTIPGTEIKFTMVPVPGGVFTMGSPDVKKTEAKMKVLSSKSRSNHFGWASTK